MRNNLKKNKNAYFNLDYFEEKIKEIEKILIKNKIIEGKFYREWYNEFNLIYGQKSTNLKLYIIFAIVYFIEHVFILKYLLNDKESIQKSNKSLKIFNEIQDKINIKYPNLDLFNFEYFKPFNDLLEKEDLSNFISLIYSISNYAFKLEIKPEYKIDFIIQNIISPIFRHKSGEYYTPPFLVKKMVEESYFFGEEILDFCCGTGNFLIEILKSIISSKNSREEKISAINNLYGYDINPISIFITKINFLYILKDFNALFKINLIATDSLFPNNLISKKKFDLIIGNPPWYTYSDIDSVEYQEKVKELAGNLKIKPLPKNILNIEISCLFFYQAKNLYMKDNAKIFFVMTKGVITGSHASRFRNFIGFNNVKIWTFEKKIENVFNIDFICLFAQKSENKLDFYEKEIPNSYFIVENGCNNLDYFSDVNLKQERIENLVPYSITKKGAKQYVKKLISKELSKELLPIQPSYYKKLFHKGADLNPRNLIFIKYKKVNNSLVKINPDERIFKRAKFPWNNKEFKNEIVEKKYIFKVVKSTELVKFCIYYYYNVFLPNSRKDLSFNYSQLDKNAKNFYDRINKIYLKYKKDTTKHKSLMDNLNRWSKLINERQLSEIKVVYNNSGSILNSAVIQGNFLATGDLSFYDTDNLNEAYYLTAILNSPLITKQIQIIKSSRHIFKIPLDLPIKKFNIYNQDHLKLVNLGKNGELIAKTIVDDILKKNKTHLSKYKIQNELNKKLTPILNQIDEILHLELKSSKIQNFRKNME